MNLVRYADRPDLLDIRFERLSKLTFPEYMHNNTPGNLYWGRLYSEFPDFQVALLENDELVAEAHALPVPWDGTVDGLPSGWDEGFVEGMTSGQEPGALMALAISVQPGRQGQQLSSRMIQAFRDTARAAGLESVLAPVRPTWKARYPLIPIEEYMTWRREDGAHFDPWLRIHERVGGEVLGPAPRSMVMEAPVTDWEEWTEMPVPGRRRVRLPRRSCDARGRERRRPARRAERLGAPSFLGRERDHTVRDDHEAVAAERFDRLDVEIGHRLRLRGDETQQCGTALAERALEPRLLPRRLVAAASGRAALGERAHVAARDPGQADRGPEVEQTLQRFGAECVPGPLLDARDIRVDGEHGRAVGLVADCRVRVGPHAR